jgi:hypothetical protein
VRRRGGGRGLVPAAIGAIALGTGCFAHDYKTRPRVAVVDGDPVVQMAPEGKFKSLFQPTLVPLRQHTDPPFRNEKVVGVALAEPARMYPIGLLDDYEVVNDEAAGTPYVVARCALTNLSTVLDRRVGGRTLTFENSGALWRDMLVLRDRETGTYWTPATGRALSGPLAAETLTVLPAAMTTAEAWREYYPSTVCLDTGNLSAVPLRLRLYAMSSWEGVSGEKTTDRRFKPKAEVFYVAGRAEALAFPAAEIREKKAVAASLEGSALTIEWDGGLRVPRAFRPTDAGKQELPVVPIYWFALLEQFPQVRTLSDPSPDVSGTTRSSVPTENFR